MPNIFLVQKRKLITWEYDKYTTLTFPIINSISSDIIKSFLLDMHSSLNILELFRYLVEGTYDKDVPEASLRTIQRSGVFLDDQTFMRRLAWGETQFQESSKTYRSAYDGGTWQLDEVCSVYSKN